MRPENQPEEPATAPEGIEQGEAPVTLDQEAQEAGSEEEAPEEGAPEGEPTDEEAEGGEEDEEQGESEDDDELDLTNTKPRTQKRILKLLERATAAETKLAAIEAQRQAAEPQAEAQPGPDLTDPFYGASENFRKALEQMEPQDKAFVAGISQMIDARYQAHQQTQQTQQTQAQNELVLAGNEFEARHSGDDVKPSEHQEALQQYIVSNPLLAEAVFNGPRDRKVEAFELAWSGVRASLSAEQIQKQTTDRAKRTKKSLAASTKPRASTPASSVAPKPASSSSGRLGKMASYHDEAKRELEG